MWERTLAFRCRLFSDMLQRAAEGKELPRNIAQHGAYDMGGRLLRAGDNLSVSQLKSGFPEKPWIDI